ncbi:pentapeptide repeat-containing protein [bacterium]|nr:pentapeptide repeat-containing protein [bacterium]
MANTYFYEEQFKQIDVKKGLTKGSYEACQFLNCTLPTTNLEHYEFVDCEFVDCDLSSSLITHTAFKNVQFVGCKLMGLHFDTCNSFLLEMHFEKCHLQMSIFYNLKLKGSRFIDCMLQQADFSEADLSGADFAGSQLQDAVFDHSNLEKSNFAGAIDYQINPVNNKLKGARFSKDGLQGLLTGLGIVVLD